ncbi:MAG TPA: alpha/beta hydrolase [Geobacteraceae bacterium]|nr:alpha/beta hydrolase [Geobacteraceae bacterium]
MISESVLPFVHRSIRNNQAIREVATAATDLFRQMSIKPHVPKVRRRELSLRHNFPSVHSVRCGFYREKGAGAVPTIVIAGFVPDATEVVEFQRFLFKSFGDIYYVNYPRGGFSTEMFFAQLADMIENLNNKGEEPVLFSISFGSGLMAGFLRSGISRGLRIRGIVLASPVLCKEDLVRPKGERTGGVRMLESNLNRILRADPDNSEEINRQIERARRCFQALFEAGAENRKLTRRHLSIRKKIMDVLEKTTFTGGYERVMALKQFAVPDPSERLFPGPALVLYAESEENVLVATSPTLAALNDLGTFRAILPRGTIKKVVSRDGGDPVAHASVIFHHGDYNPLLASWYSGLPARELRTAL